MTEIQLPDPLQVVGDDPTTCATLETYLHARFSAESNSPFSAATQVVSFASAGEGNMNRTLRVALRGAAHASVILKQSLPYVAKYPDIPAPIERDRAEAAFFKTLTTTPHLGALCPELLAEDPANHLLVLQDLGAGKDWSSIYSGGALTQRHTDSLGQLLQWLSQLHRASVPAGYPPNLAMRQLNHEHLFVIPMQTDNGCAEYPCVGEKQQELAANLKLRNRLQELGKLYLRETNSGHLLHGDFYPGSWLSVGHEVHVIDPEFTFVGPAEYDVGIFAAHLLIAGYPNSDLRQLLTKYQPADDFSTSILRQFMGMEIIRRLLGVAKLPLAAEADAQLALLHTAEALLLEPTPQDWLHP